MSDTPEHDMEYEVDGVRYVADFKTAEDLECIDGPDGCAGPVAWRTTPDRTDGRAFQRCVAHFERRLADSEHILELTSPCPAPWFDPANAGESWDEDE